MLLLILSCGNKEQPTATTDQDKHQANRKEQSPAASRQNSINPIKPKTKNGQSEEDDNDLLGESTGTSRVFKTGSTAPSRVTRNLNFEEFSDEEGDDDVPQEGRTPEPRGTAAVPVNPLDLLLGDEATNSNNNEPKDTVQQPPVAIPSNNTANITPTAKPAPSNVATLENHFGYVRDQKDPKYVYFYSMDVINFEKNPLAHNASEKVYLYQDQLAQLDPEKENKFTELSPEDWGDWQFWQTAPVKSAYDNVYPQTSVEWLKSKKK